MQDEKTAKIIESVRNMTDHEAEILEIFISGFRAGKQMSNTLSTLQPAELAGHETIVLAKRKH